jgi:hypothetical protein
MGRKFCLLFQSKAAASDRGKLVESEPRFLTCDQEREVTFSVFPFGKCTRLGREVCTGIRCLVYFCLSQD